MTTPRPWSAGEFAGLLAMPGSFVIGDASAFALGRVVLDEAELLTLATDPAWRRRGLARARLSGFHDRARQNGAGRAFLEVAADNAAARALYDGAGYGIVGTRRAYYTRPDGMAVDAWIMACPLGPV